MANSPDMLFQYLCDIVYDIGNASLSIDEIDEAHQLLGKALMQLWTMLKEERDFAFALSKGNLSLDPPSSENELASPLKSLHASLRHLTWQSQQVALGDYKQIVNFMGEFSDAFNTMTEQLDKRQTALEQEIEAGRKKTEALVQSNDILTHIMQNSAQMILLFDEKSCGTVYQNKAAEAAVQTMPGFLSVLVPAAKKAREESAAETEISFFSGEEKRYFSVALYHLIWEGNETCALVVQDITQEKANLAELEFYANKDELTGLNNRHAGMAVLEDWIARGQPFVLCFLDLDNLKYVNDTYGHDEGDNYIISSANRISSAFEKGVSCRLGGDEFMLLIPDKSFEQAEQRIGELCAGFSADESLYERRISYGCVEVFSDNSKSAQYLLGVADRRMYEQKRRYKEMRAKQIQK